MLLQSRPVLGVTRGPTDGGKTSFGGQKPTFLQPHKCPPHVWVGDFFLGIACSGQILSCFAIRYGPRCTESLLLLQGAPDEWRITSGGPLPISAIRKYSRPGIHSWHHVWGWGRTTPLSYNSEQELARPATLVPYPDPESSSDPVSSSFLEFWPSPEFWTILMSCPDPDSVIAHVRIWLTVLCYSVEHGMSRSVPDQESSPDPEIFRILVAWKFLLAEWASHPLERPELAQPPL